MRRSLLIAGAAAALARPAGVRAAPPRPLRIAVLGDSLALGTGASKPDGGFLFRAYRALLRERPGSEIDDFAIGGSTVDDVLRLQTPRLAGTRYDIAIVCAGSNDVVRRTAGAPFAFAFGTLLRRIAALAPGTRLVCCGVPDVSVSPLFAAERDAIAAASREDDRAVRSAAAAAGASFVDLYTVTHAARDAAGFLSGDRFHPSDRGYALLTGVLTPVLDRVVRALA